MTRGRARRAAAAHRLRRGGRDRRLTAEPSGSRAKEEAMTPNVRRASPDDEADGRGDVPHDESAALESVENGEAVAIPSVGGFLRGVGLALAQAGPVTREAGRLARDTARIVRGTEDHLPSPKDKRFRDPAW